ncbi:MAG: hypothetical protein ACOY90_04195 [Candidatus Zhuqueibacterota bacterium]
MAIVHEGEGRLTVGEEASLPVVQPDRRAILGRVVVRVRRSTVSGREASDEKSVYESRQGEIQRSVVVLR